MRDKSQNQRDKSRQPNLYRLLVTTLVHWTNIRGQMGVDR